MMSSRAEDAYPSAASLCDVYGLSANKNWGQNFLDDAHIIQKILAPFELGNSCSVLEIGPGLGHMSQAILASGASLCSLEIDQRFAPVLDALCRDYPKFNYQITDARQLDWSQLLGQGEQQYLLGNLPYYISSELFLQALVQGYAAHGLAFLLQRELSQRLLARPGSKNYGPLNVLARLWGKLELGVRVRPGAFYPRPQVESQVLYIWRDNSIPLCPREFSHFAQFLAQCFALRRKTLRNNILAWQNFEHVKTLMAILEESPAAPLLRQRPEQIAPSDYLYLYRLICNNR